MTSPRTTNIRQSTNLLTLLAAIILMAAGLQSCTDAPDAPADPSYAFLRIHVNATDISVDARSRADIGSDIWYYEAPEASNELISSLRIIIVDSRGRVEANEFLNFGSENAAKTAQSSYHRVAANDRKLIYAIANEESISKLIDNYESTMASLTVGSIFPASTINDMTMAIPEGQTTLFGADAPIPMSECFEYDLKAPTDGSDRCEANIFVTRAATKISAVFNLKEPVYTEADLDAATLAIEAIGTREYLIPRNTTYSPAKAVNEVSNVADIGNRYITAYDVPTVDNPLNTFTIPEWSPAKNTQIENVEGYKTKQSMCRIYLPETKLPIGVDGYQTYTAIINVRGQEYRATLPNLPSLPRNTHVRIIITADLVGQIQMWVRVIPYTAVPLNPQFGFDDPLPIQIDYQEAPPWLKIDPEAGYTDTLQALTHLHPHRLLWSK